MNLQLKNGKVLVENIVTLASRILTEEPEKIEIIRKIAEICVNADVNNSERCEASAMAYTCAIDEAKKTDFNLKDFI